MSDRETARQFDDRRPGRWTNLREQAERLAAPLPPLLLEAERIAATVTQGVHGRRRVGTGETFWQFRRYRVEDASGAIDWRQSAKSQHWFVRETEWESAESIWLWRDASASMDYRSRWSATSKRDRATVLTLALMSLLVRAGERIGLLDEPDPAANGRIALRRMAHRLTEGTARPDDLPPGKHLPRFARVVLMGDLLAPVETVTRRIAELAQGGVSGHVLQILDPAEEDFPFAGRTRFEGLDDHMSLLFGRAEALRGGYCAALAAHRDAIGQACRHQGWTFATHRTDRPPQLALLALYQALSVRRSALSVAG